MNARSALYPVGTAFRVVPKKLEVRENERHGERLPVDGSRGMKLEYQATVSLTQTRHNCK